MRTKLIESNKPERYIHSVRNADTTPGGFTAGQPVVLNLQAIPQPPTYTNGLPAGWEDGLQVVLPSTAGFTGSQLFFYGVAAGPIAPQVLGESVIFGPCMAAVARGTRSATTAPWPAGVSAAAASNFLGIDTINNCFITVASVSTGALASLVLLDNLPAYASSASSPGDTRTTLTQLARAFIRIM